MTPHKQLIVHNPEIGDYGDCHRTCIAMILDMHPSEVPHFCDKLLPDTPSDADEAQEWLRMEREWLDARGLSSLTFPIIGDGMDLANVMRHLDSWMPNTPIILGGTSGLGSGHSVVYHAGELHDPSGNGIVGPMSDGYWWITAIAVGMNWSARRAG